MNQNQTHRIELKGGFLWSPKTARGGRKHYFYDTASSSGQRNDSGIVAIRS